MMTDSPTPTFSADDAEAAASTRPHLSGRAWVAVVAGIAALVAVASYFGLWWASAPVRWQEVGFSVESPTATTITFEVYLYTDEPVTCQVEALNRYYAQVGVASVDVDSAAGAQQLVSLPIATVEQATAAVVADCRPS